ncbi:protein abrupt-like isoform X1 [Daphnia pulex]|uniref:protein abrupt-like isoform X1 n=1 Tax=Daphnia pulex TaxID=6669 RepID=UPI001EDF3DAF|nr:protein abrupt-like isoform X1 [Daphnia pulex]
MTSQQLFRLHWKNHSPNFVSVFSQLLNTESLVDVTLACDGKQIQAHRVVLSACSTYFQELFVSHPCQHPIVLLKDIKFEDLHTVIHFMYYGEVNIQHDQLNSILKTAEVLHVKGFADVADKESFSAALLTQQNQPLENLSESRQHSEHSQEFLDDCSLAAKRKRQRNGSGSSQMKSGSQEQLSSHSPLLKRQNFQSSKEATDSSMRSSSSLDSNSVIKSQSSLAGQSSVESNVDNEYFFPRENDSKPPICSTGSLDTATAMMENGASCGLPLSKQKRTRTLMRQDCVTRKEGDKDATGGVENERASPIIHTFQPILPKTQKSISETELAELRQRSQTTTTYLQIPPRQTAPQLTRQRSQPIQPRPSGTTLSPALGNASSTTPPPPQSMNIPTLAVTPVSSAPNIVIEHYPTIIRLVSIEEMNTGTDPPLSAIPTLTRASSCTGGTSTDTLQVPCFATDSVPSSSSHSPSKLRQVKAEENLRRSISNPGVSSSPPVSTPSTNGHCPVLRTGAALGCNYCWNTNDSHGRILRRKTKYHCPDCQANLCIVPCFQEFHEKFVSSNETKSSGSQQKGSSTSHQMSKMSSF